jgi:hypothetical protein
MSGFLTDNKEGQGSALDPLGPEACWTGDKVDKLDRRHG